MQEKHRAQGAEHRAQGTELRAQGTGHRAQGKVTGLASRAGRANCTRPARQGESCIGWIPSSGGARGGF